ncbi:LLM class F420-dependent oxidoreductase [Streptosporangium sp. CA-115845]|uniref:LLM class F420-dependent oxidoreductase n=1 Tax=Streptosporangium sp. CA-115845 TaxID=3240071 RepID=UPI003D8B7259
MPSAAPDLGTIGVWSAHLRSRDRDAVRRIAGTLDELGYGTLWVPGGSGGDLFGDVDTALTATTRAVIATGVLNIWMHDAASTATWHAGTRERHPGRVLLGLGNSHAALVESTDQTYHRPLSALRDYLDALDAAPSPVPAEQRILAALGPKMLELATRRSIGAHPYLVDTAHTRTARHALGPDAVLAPELKVVFDTDRDRAREVARAHLDSYLRLPNYTRNLLRSGFTEDDITGGGSARLVDGVVAWGDVDTIVRRAQEHIDAGADHVCVQVLTANRRDVPLTAWRELAPALLEGVTARRRARSV